MKKIMAMVVLAMFIFSIMPYALADEGKPMDVKKAKGLKIGESFSPEKAKELMRHKEERDKRKGEIKERREKFRESLGEVKRLCKDKEWKDCKEGREHFAKFVDELRKIADELGERLEKIKARLNEAKEETPQDLSAKVDEAIGMVNKAKELLSGEPSRDKIKDAAGLLKSVVKMLKEKNKDLKERVMAKKFEQLMKHADKVTGLINRFIEKARPEEKAKLEDLKIKIEQTVTGIKTAVNSGNTERAKELMQNLHDLLKEVVQMFAHDKEGRDNTLRGVVKKEVQTAGTA